MLRRLGVRGKILATLAVPILVLAALAGWIAWQSYQDERQATQTSALIASLEAQDRAGTAFAAERALNIAISLEIPGAKEQLAAAQKETDEALVARDAILRNLDTSALDPRVGEAVRRTLVDKGAVDALQTRVAEGTIAEEEATDKYNGVIRNALEVPRILAATTANRDLAPRIEAYVDLDETLLSNTEERPFVGFVLASLAAGKQPSAEASLKTASLLRQTDSRHEASLTALSRVPGRHIIPSFSGPLGDIREALLISDFESIDRADARDWAELSQEWVNKTKPVRDEVRAETAVYAVDLADEAQRTLYITAGAALVIVVMSFVFALMIAQRIVVPLRRLTAVTSQVRERLPQMVEQMAVPGQAPSIDLVQIPVESRDEIGRLAAAFNDVNETTMEVAREQAALRGSIAEMFVNVARRDQVLLNRQLAFLDELERSEEDATTLSNLFRLDHLATRMRRNAESLLVLAGIDSGRRVRQPMPTSDVIRTASSEIELYDRVRLNLGVDPLMLGHNALNAAHLLAELLENATMFSEPHTPVEVSTARDERGVIVTVRDHGLGMTPEEIAEANRKVASTSASDSVGAQRLGLFVVGRLADRLGAAVGFGTGADGTGTVVTVVFPAVLFLPDDAVPLPQPTDPLESTTQAAAARFAPPQTATSAVPSAAPAMMPATGAAPSSPAPVAPSGPAPLPPMPAPAAPPQAPAAPQRTPAFASSTSFLEPEPPAAVPVDIDSLTDGTTAAGMPRRRRSEESTSSGSIVLPPLPTPDFADFAIAEDTWRPPSEVAGSATSLPSRSRTEAVQEPEPEPLAPVLGVDQRTTLFSSFRSMDDIDPENDQTLQLDAVADDPGAVPEHLSQPAPAASTPPPASSFASVSSGTRESESPTRQGADNAYESLPAFEDLMADLPTRRAVREANGGPNRKRGLFGRKPASESGQVEQAEPNGPSWLSAAESAPAPEPAWDAGQQPAPAEPTRVSAYGAPVAAAPAAYAPPVAAAPASAPAPAPARQTSEFRPPTYDSVPYQPRAVEPAPPAPEPTRPAPTYGGSVLPLRSTSNPETDPLDPQYVPDTVEARSEWMASAVLYEEMSTLLRRGVFQEENVTAKNDDTYRPTTVVAEGAGLVRRTRSDAAATPAQRFTARIERDPEQLRARLSAFQSATTRGRGDATPETLSTAAGSTMNDVPGSTPQSR